MKNNKLNRFLKGYTMVEMLLVLTIISILSVGTMAASVKYTELTSSLLNDVNSVTMLIREMQNKTSGFVASDSVSTPNVGYGIFLDLSSKNKIEPFYKTNTDTFSIAETLSSKPEQNLLLDSKNSFTRICVNGCSTYSSATKVAVYFLKPKSYAVFAIPNPTVPTTYINTIPATGVKINRVCFELTSLNGKHKKRIDIHYVGQISFASGPCQ
ncbi:hypothetical protein SDC9_08001 [bioreactor metagenome]|uniref:Prepilin-type N-terminal cleavage/methylation domain-containing protein n=1 Tax=bioreactor metagenome TaxID=1076179 RepID=A0A644T911_9ZZZZ|nr:type II secretion system protein [Candidatus Elulimicrobiales bacterium]